MKNLKLNAFSCLCGLGIAMFAACSNDSSSNASSEEIESSDSEEVTSSSSEKVAPESSSSKKDVSSSSYSKKESSSSSVSAESSSSKKDKSSSSHADEESSSSEKVVTSSASTPPTDPIEIFNPRVPQEAVYHCEEEESSYTKIAIDFDQQDWICTFEYANKKGYVYVQGTPTSCEARFSLSPTITADTALLYIDGEYVTLEDLTYNWGGNHHNDSFRFTYDGKVYEYDHSSYGWGYRKCQEMDCLKVYEADGKTLIEDGCGEYEDDLQNVRKLPVVCRFADIEDGSFGSFEDTFEFCNGDHRLIDELNDE